jgi:hypothetical protein
MRIDVKYAANVQPGDLVAGRVVPDAPTRPVRPIAHAMRVESVEAIVPDPEWPSQKSYLFHYDVGTSSTYYMTDQVLVIAGVS